MVDPNEMQRMLFAATAAAPEPEGGDAPASPTEGEGHVSNIRVADTWILDEVLALFDSINVSYSFDDEGVVVHHQSKCAR